MATSSSSTAAAGLSASRLVEDGGLPSSGPVALGVKLVNRVGLLGRGGTEGTVALGAMSTKTRAGRETATAGNLELKAALGPPAKRGQAVLGGSFMNFRGDVALGGNLAAQANPTPDTTVAARLQLNSKGAGGVTLRVTSHDAAPRYGASLLVPLLGMLLERVRGRLGGGRGGLVGGGEGGDGEGEDEEGEMEGESEYEEGEEEEEEGLMVEEEEDED